jgi:hypothetical protein
LPVLKSSAASPCGSVAIGRDFDARSVVVRRHSKTSTMAMMGSQDSQSSKLVSVAHAGVGHLTRTLVHIVALGLLANGCGQIEPPPEVAAPTMCGHASIDTGFAAHAVWIRPGDASAALALLVTVRRIAPSFEGDITFSMSDNTEAAAIDVQPNGDIVLRSRTFVSPEIQAFFFRITCNDGTRGRGRVTVPLNSAPVEGQTEAATMSSP